MPTTDVHAVCAAIERRHAELAALLSGLSTEELRAPSRLPDWSRLTVACHLRYGAEASAAMTIDVVAGRSTAFYPAGRAAQRPSTLHPRPGERPGDVVDSLIECSARLDRRWASLDRNQWGLLVREPRGNIDLGHIPLETLTVLRLTEIEVHGDDLDIGAGPWSDTFVDHALPMRLGWLPTRRSNHRPVDRDISATWIISATDGADYAISVGPGGVSVTDSSVTGSVAAEDIADGDARISGRKRDLLAFLLGRLPIDELSVDGDPDAASTFLLAFPAP